MPHAPWLTTQVACEGICVFVVPACVEDVAPGFLGVHATRVARGHLPISSVAARMVPDEEIRTSLTGVPRRAEIMGLQG